jgi:hypothetical protein
VILKSKLSFYHVQLKFSVEHQGFRFEKDPAIAAESLKMHSGGKISVALKMALDSS